MAAGRAIATDRSETGVVGRGVAIALGSLLFVTTLAFGGVHEWASALAECGLWALGGIWFVASGPDRRWLAFVPLYAVLGFQLLPLPRTTLTLLSPRTAELYEKTVDRITASKLSDVPIQPVSAAADQAIPLGVRERVREAARAAWDEGRGQSKPLALYPYATRSSLLLVLACGVAWWLAAALPVPERLLGALALAGSAIATLAIVELVTRNGHVLWFFDPYESGPIGNYARMLGPFVNPDHLATFLELTLAPSAALLASRSRRGGAGRIVGGAALALGLALMVAALLGSASRGGMVGAALSLGVMSFAWTPRKWDSERGAERRRDRPRRNRAERVRSLARAAAAVAIVLAGLVYAGPQARRTLDERLADRRVASELEFRSAMTLQTLPVLRDFPWFGVGAGCWREVYRRYERYPMVGMLPNHAHDDYVEWAAEIGLVGLLAAAVAVGTLIRAARRNGAAPKAVRFGILGAVVAVAWHEASDFGLRAPANALWLAVLVGLACNPRWGARSVRSDGGERLGPRPAWRVAVAIATTAVLLALSVEQFREFRQWSAVRSGSLDLFLDPVKAETWDEVAMRLDEAGLRREPPTAECLRLAILRRPAFEGAFWRLSLAATNPQRALAMLETALYLDPTRAAWRARHAAMLDGLGRGADALHEIEEATYLSPILAEHPILDPRAHPPEAVLEAAERGFRRALAERPADVDLLGEVARFYERFGIWGDAGALYMKAGETSGDWADYGLRAGRCYAEVRNFTRAEELLRRAIAADPSADEPVRTLALSVLLPAKRDAEAETVLASGIRRSRRVASLYQALADIRRARGDARAAAEAVAEAAEHDPRNPERLAELGRAYLELEDYHRAKIAFDRAIALAPSRGDLRYYKGTAEERLYDLGGALADYRKAAELSPRNASYVSSAERLARSFEQGKREASD